MFSSQPPRGVSFIKPTMSIHYIPAGPLALPAQSADNRSKMDLSCHSATQASVTVHAAGSGAPVVATRPNAINPFSATPNEIILQIFAFLYGSTTAEDIRDQIYHASAVCKLWDALIKQTPKFWTTLPKLRSPSGLPYNQTASLPTSYGEDEEQSQVPAGPVWSCACKCFEEASAEHDTSGSSSEEVDSSEGSGASGEGLESDDEEDGSVDSDEEEDEEDEEQENVEEEGNEVESAEEIQIVKVNTLFSSYLHILLKFLVRSYPLAVEAHLCLPPDEVFVCQSCGTKDLLVYTVLHVLARARTVSFDVHTSSVRQLKNILRYDLMGEESYLPGVVKMMEHVNNLTIPAPPAPAYKASCRYPYLEDLSIILSHSANPEQDEHSAYSVITSLFKGVKLKHLAIVNSIRVLPQMHIQWQEPLFLCTDLFHKASWSSLTIFQGAFTGLGDIFVVLAAARNLEEALFIVHLKNKQVIFPVGEMEATGRAIGAIGVSDSEDIAMSSLRSLTIKITGDSFQAEPLRTDNEDGEPDEQPDGPGKALFRYILKGVQFPALQTLTLSAAFLLFNGVEPYLSDDSRDDLEDFFGSCQSTLTSFILDKMPIRSCGKTPYISDVRVPTFYMHLFEVLLSTPSLQNLVILEPVPFDQFENIAEIFYGHTQLVIDGATRKLPLPEPLERIKMALRYRGMTSHLVNQEDSLPDMLRKMALQEGCDVHEQEWIGYSVLTTGDGIASIHGN